MNQTEFKKYCLQKAGTIEDFPFDLVTLVLKVGGKIFAITDISDEVFKISLKCEPDYALHLRANYPSVIPGYHLNKQHWNTVTVKSEVPEDLLYSLIDHSYELVFNSLTKIKRNQIEKHS